MNSRRTTVSRGLDASRSATMSSTSPILATVDRTDTSWPAAGRNESMKSTTQWSDGFPGAGPEALDGFLPHRRGGALRLSLSGRAMVSNTVILPAELPSIRV